MGVNYNILITSISKKIPLLKAVRQSIVNLNLKGKIFGGDSNSQCIGRYFTDEFWHMPQQNALYIKELINFCKKNQIKAIIPTRDGELPFFSMHRETLAEQGIACMVSPSQCIETCQNKFLFYQFLLPKGIPVIPSALDLEEISSKRYVVKECFGAGGQSIGLNLSKDEAKAWAKNLKKPLFQPFIEGKEFSVDVYIDHQKSPHGAIARSRDLVVNGESQITSSVKQPEMQELSLNTALMLGIEGHAVFQILRDSANRLHLIECNPRFGGASSLSIAMGLHSFEWFILESLQKALPLFKRNSKELMQVRYPEDKVIPQ